MTAEEFFKNNSRLRNNEVVSDMTNIMIEFAKYHVEQALLKVANSDMDAICSWSGNPYTSEGSDSIDFDKVMKIYHLKILNNMKQREYCPYCQGGPCTGECDKDNGTR